MITEAYIAKLPDCQICEVEDLQTEIPAEYDGKTIMGPWANMCAAHFASHGVGLGTGKGQKLIVGENQTLSKTEIAARVQQAVTDGASFDDIEELVGDGDIAEYL